MATADPTLSPRHSVDSHGRLLPMTDAELQARAIEIARMLDEIALITDETDTDEMWERFTREIDEDRLSDRKRFRDAAGPSFPRSEAPPVGGTPMADAHPTLSPHRTIDATGRALPMTDDEIRARNEIAIRALNAIDDMGDEEEQRQTLEALMKAVDEEPLSDRKRFR